MKYDKGTLAVQWHITNTCEMHCRHCYFNHIPVQQELCTTGFITLLSQLCSFFEENNLHMELFLTGGNPMLHSGWEEIGQELHHRNIPFSILGNPHSITQESVEKLCEYGVKSVQFSLDGMEQMHDWFRGEGSFRKIRPAVKILQEHGIDTALMFTLYDTNKNELILAMKYAQELGVNRFSFDLGVILSEEYAHGLRMLPMEEMESLFTQYIQSKEQLKKSGSSIFFEEKCSVLNLMRVLSGDYAFCREPEHVIYDGCQAGVNDIVISVTGDVIACPRMKNSKLGNLFEASLNDIWYESEMVRSLRRKHLNKQDCCQCRFLSWCQGCDAYESAIAACNHTVPKPICSGISSLKNQKMMRGTDGADRTVKERTFISQNFYQFSSNMSLAYTPNVKKELVRLIFDKPAVGELIEDYYKYAFNHGFSEAEAQCLYWITVSKMKL